MGLFDKPEVIVLKESSDAKNYLVKLEELQKTLMPGTEIGDKIDKEIAITKAGIAGEDSILFELKNSGMDLVVLHDLYIETSDGLSAQIDYLVITPYVNVFIECKNLFGNIEINNKGDFIRSFQYRGHWIKEGIYNPITQNERHMTVFKAIRAKQKNVLSRLAYEKYFPQYNKSLVVLANPKTVVYDKYAPKSVKESVIRGDQLITTLKGMKSDVKNSKSEMLSAAEQYLAYNCEDRKEYILKLEKLVRAQSEMPKEPEKAQLKEPQKETTSKLCPRCGKPLILRIAKKGNHVGEQFYGCSGFPSCRYTEKA